MNRYSPKQPACSQFWCSALALGCALQSSNSSRQPRKQSALVEKEIGVHKVKPPLRGQPKPLPLRTRPPPPIESQLSAQFFSVGSCNKGICNVIVQDHQLTQATSSVIATSSRMWPFATSQTLTTGSLSSSLILKPYLKVF